VVHADFYRLADPREVAELGLDDYRADAALIAEWAEHVGGFANEPGCLAVTVQVCPVPGETAGETGDGGRIAIVEGGRDWLGRMPC
jgi:tRNA threonylcarbamoyladenosine biosynthesis protein TsaE